MGTLWSMSPWAGLKRRHILEACRSSLMSNLPHQKTFIPINKAFGKGALHRLSAVPTAQRSVCDCRSVCAINRGYVGEGKLCEGFILGCALIGGGDAIIIFFTVDVCICILDNTSSSSVHGFDGLECFFF